jgi:DNA polymerase-3 subunit gamma/tau
LEELWARLLEAVGRASPFTRTYLLEAHAVSFAKNLLTIGFDPQFEDHISLVDNARNHALLQTKLNELGRPNAQVKFIKAEAKNRPAAPTPPPAPAQKTSAPVATASAKAAAPVPAPAKEKLASVPFSQDEFKNDPLIQKALEMFKAQIVEVRA